MLRATVQGPGMFELDFKRNIVKQLNNYPTSFPSGHTFINLSGVTQIYIDKGYHEIQGTSWFDATATPLGPSFIPQSQSIPPFPTVDPSAVAALETKRVCECGAEKARTTHAHWCPKWS